MTTLSKRTRRPRGPSPSPSASPLRWLAASLWILSSCALPAEAFGWSNVVVPPTAATSPSSSTTTTSTSDSNRHNPLPGPLFSASSSATAEHDVVPDQAEALGAAAATEEGDSCRDEAASKAAASTETLVFTGDFVHLSDPIPLERRSELAAFMRRDEARHLLLSVGGKRPAQKRELSKDLLDLWVESCNGGYGDASLPDPDVDEVVSSESVVNFPGLKLTSVIYSGTKLLLGKSNSNSADDDDRSDDGGLPAHEFVMVAEQQRVEGAPPMVWLYRKLTGADSRGGDRAPKLSNGRARSRVSIVETETDNGKKALALSFATELQIRVDFPRFLVKALPTTKEKMEEQGSAAVLKAVSQDIKDAVAATRDAFMIQFGGAASE